MGRRCDPGAGSTGVTITATHGWYTIFQTLAARNGGTFAKRTPAER
jgi:hypothetical protein